MDYVNASIIFKSTIHQYLHVFVISQEHIFLLIKFVKNVHLILLDLMEMEAVFVMETDNG